jgi:hypothetical protein
MSSGATNKGAYRFLSQLFRGGAIPANLYVALVTSSPAPTADTNTLGQLTEIGAGNGYTSGGYQLTPNSTDFDTLTENDSNDRGEVLLKDIVWTASGGSIPASGNPARYAILTDNNATVGSREVYGYWDLGSNISFASGNTLTRQDFEIRLQN